MFGQLASPAFISPIKEALVLRPSNGGRSKKSVVATMMLTSLVDAFTIVVIYLIVNSSSSEQLEVQNGLTLPTATVSQQVDDSPNVFFKDNSFYIDNRPVANESLQIELKKLMSKNSSLLKSKIPAIIVQADENVDFEKLQPILIASSYAGIQHVKFAVLQKD